MIVSTKFRNLSLQSVLCINSSIPRFNQPRIKNYLKKQCVYTKHIQVVSPPPTANHYSVAIIYKAFTPCQELHRRKYRVLHAKYDTIWHKGLEHLWTSVSVVNLGTGPQRYQGTTVYLKHSANEILLKDRVWPMEAFYEKILQACLSPLPLPTASKPDRYPWTRSTDSILELDRNMYPQRPSWTCWEGTCVLKDPLSKLYAH